MMTNSRVVSSSLRLVALVSLPLLTGCGEHNIGISHQTPTALPGFLDTPTLLPGSNTRTSTPYSGPTPTAPPQGDGSSGCRVGSQCVSGNCIEGICCAVPACPANERCDIPDAAGHCHALLETGGYCWLNAHCQSGFCVDGACCTVAGCQEGESCNVEGHAGDCSVLDRKSVV